jgi:hypothetical protein
VCVCVCVCVFVCVCVCVCVAPRRGLALSPGVTSKGYGVKV